MRPALPLLLVVLAVVPGGCGGGSDAERPAAPAVLRPQVQKLVDLAGQGGVAAGFGAVWAADSAGLVLRLDPRTGAVLARIRVANEGILAAGEGGIWLPDFGRERVARIDPATNRVAARIPARGAPSFVTAAGGSVWVALHHGNAVLRIDPARGRVVARLRASRLDIVNGGPQGVAPAAGRIWTGVPVLRQVIPIDPRTRRAGRPVETTQEPCGKLAAVGEHLWVSPGMCGFRLMHIDARAGRQVGELQLADANVGDPAVDGDALWVPTADGTLHRVDARSGRVLARGHIGVQALSLAPAGPGVLFAAGDAVYRIRTGQGERTARD